MRSHTTPLSSDASSSSTHARTALPPALNAEWGRLEVMEAGGLGYYQDLTGENPSVVLIHSLHLGASAYEMRPLFEALRGRRRVFAVDLPGFGRSQRGDRPYSPSLYAEAIERFIVDVASPQGDPVDVVTLSQSAEFVARVAVRAPALFRSLTLISPTGLGNPHPLGGKAQGLVRRALHIAPLSAGVFRLLRAPTSLRYLLKRSFVGPVDDGLVRYAAQSAAVPDGHFASLKSIAGELSTPDAVAELYEPLKVSTRIIYDQDPKTDFDRLDALVQANPNVSVYRLTPSRGMAQFERTIDVVSLIEQPVSRPGNMA